MMKVLGTRPTLMVGMALLLVAVGIFFFPAAAAPQTSTGPLADPVGIVGAGVLTSKGYADRIVETMKARIGVNAADDDALAQLGLAYLQKARETNDPTYYAQAEDAFKRALAVNGANYDAVAGMGSLQMARHQFTDALQWGHKAQQRSPQKAYAYGIVGDAQDELGDYDQAVDTFQHMIDLRPDLSSYSRVSYARELHGDVAGAIEAMQQAATAGGPAPENVAWTHWQLGDLYFSSGQLDKAESEYNFALQAFPNYLHAQAGLGRVRAAQGRPAEAIDLYKKAIANVPLPQYVQELGDLYAATGDTANAKQQYDLVLYTFHVFEINGVDVGIEKAAFLADQNTDSAEAVQLAETAATTRHDVNTQDRLAWVLYRAGRYADALTAEQQALRLSTQSALFYFHLGMIYDKLGEAVQAHQNLQKALSINPHFNAIYAPQAAARLGQK